MSEPSNTDERRFQAQDLLELIEEVGIGVRLEGEHVLILRDSRRKLGAALVWRAKQLEPELAALLRARANT